MNDMDDIVKKALIDMFNLQVAQINKMIQGIVAYKQTISHDGSFEITPIYWDDFYKIPDE